jgi:GH15 family glucan-1,4-alpha-glucosidase
VATISYGRAIWSRPAGALVALGAEQEARDTLRYLIATQIGDGHWYQNQWLGGKPYWEGIQLDETAFPVLLAATLDEREALSGIEVEDMVRRALGFIACTGPATEQDRWEESTGIVPIHNRAEGGGVPGDELVGTEFLQLVRFGLRSPGDPLILDSIRVADALLKTDTPCGPVGTVTMPTAMASTTTEAPMTAPDADAAGRY